MFTQCSNCNTVFELSAEVLRAAGGQVRCGRCGEIFNALARLAEEASSFDMGESAYEMEERADNILETVAPPPLPSESLDVPEEEYDGSEIAQLQVLDFGEDNLIDESFEDAIAEAASYSDAALEFTLPPGELDRIFIESSVGIIPPFSSMESSGLESLEPPQPESAAEQPDNDLIEIEELELPEPTPAPAAPQRGQIVPFADDGLLPDIEVISDDRPPTQHGVPLAVPGPFDLNEPPKKSARSLALWSSGAIAALLLLLAQVLHHNREALTVRGPLAPLLRALYVSVGAPLGGMPNLAAFQLRQWGVTGAAAGDETLRVRASILNASTQMQPFPLLRVTLANRYGTRIGTRDFAPAEYLGKPVARQLSPGEKVDAMLNILDPGKEAEGFEIDVCLPGGEKKILCANDSAPSQARR